MGAPRSATTPAGAARAVADLIRSSEAAHLRPAAALERGAIAIARAAGAAGTRAYLVDAVTAAPRLVANWGTVPPVQPVPSAQDVVGDWVGRLTAGGRQTGAVALFGVTPGAAETADIEAALELLAAALRGAQLTEGLAALAGRLASRNRLVGGLTRIAAATGADGAVEVAEGVREGLAARHVEIVRAADPEPVRVAQAGVSSGGQRARVAITDRISLLAEDPEDDTAPETLDELVPHVRAALDRIALADSLAQEVEERRRVGAALAEAQDAERRRIAEALHDGPIQELVGLALRLEALGGDLPDSAARERASEGAATARETVARLREAVFDLHPLASEELSLAEVATRLARRLEGEGVRVARVEVPDALAPEDPARGAAARILGEAVANVIRHAAADSVEIVVAADGDWLDVTVADDGRGFAADRLERLLAEGHLGLLSLRQRAELAGGRLTIESAPGAGTEVHARLPLTRS